MAKRDVSAQPTLALEVLSDRVLLDLEVSHDLLERLNRLVQSRNDRRRRELRQAQQEHVAEHFDVVDV